MAVSHGAMPGGNRTPDFPPLPVVPNASLALPSLPGSDAAVATPSTAASDPLCRRLEVPPVRDLAVRMVAAADGMDPGAAAADAIRRLDLQRRLPAGERDFVEPWHFNFPDIPDWVLWVLLGLGIAVVLYWLVSYFADWPLFRRPRWADAAGNADGAGESAGVALPIPADDLARDGRFVEAMHALLLQSLADIRQTLDAKFADSLTSREILRHAPLPEPGEASLRDIIARVEWTYFGEHPAGPADYQACRAQFNELARVLGGRVPG